MNVDVIDAHLDQIPEVQYLFDGGHALAAPDLRNVHEAVTAGKDIYECAKLGGGNDSTLIDRPRLNLRWVENEFDTTTGLGHCLTVNGTDRDRTDASVVIDRNVCARLLLHGVDDFALGPDDLADLVHRDLEADDLRGGRADLGTRRRDRRVHDLEDLQAGLFGLLEGSGQHVGRDTVDLRVELESRHELGGSRDFEVHVAEGIFGSEDVGEGGVFTFGEHEAHGDAGDGGLRRDTRVHKRHR